MGIKLWSLALLALLAGGLSGQSQFEVREWDAAGALIGDNDPAPGTYRDVSLMPAGAFYPWFFHFTNNGPNPITFGGGGNPPYAFVGANPSNFGAAWHTIPNPLPVGGTVTLEVAFNSSGSGTGFFSGTLELYHNATGSGVSPFQLNMQANVVPGPWMSVNFGSPTGPQIVHQSPTTGTGRDFGSRSIHAGPSAPITIWITNSGPVPITLGSPYAGSGWWTDYVVSSTGMASQLAVGASTSFTIAFDPVSTGQKDAAILLQHNSFWDNPSPFWIPVTGIGTNTPVPVMTLQQGTTVIADNSSFNAGAHVVSVPTGLSFNVQNAGSVTLNLTGTPIIQIGGLVLCTAVVSVNPASTVIAPGGGVSFTLSITPLAAGPWSFSMSIPNDDPLRNPYDVLVFGTAAVMGTELRLISQPVDSAAGSVFTVAPVVAITDAAGNVDTNDNSTQVEVAITAGTGNPSANLSGTISLTAVNGIVTFSDLEISHRGNGYTLTFTDITGSLGSVESDPFNVSGGGGGDGDEGDEEEETCSTGSQSRPWVAGVLMIAVALFWRRTRRQHSEEGVL